MPGFPSGLAAQESGAQHAADLGVPFAAKRWPVSGGFLALDRELAAAEGLDVELIVGWTWQNETYAGAPSALPSWWPKVCWSGAFAGCGPDYSNSAMRSLALQSIRDLAARYDGHAQIAAFMANVGDDGEIRYCKRPVPDEPCWEAYEAAGLTRPIWEQFIQNVIRTWATSFTETPVLLHYSGPIGHTLDWVSEFAVSQGLGLFSSGLYPGMCRGNSFGGVCNPDDLIVIDWQVPLVYSNTVPIAVEQSLGYVDGQAALSWLWAVTHGASQVHAQRNTLANSLGAEWRETVEYMLANPGAALWVARDLDRDRCKAWYGENGDYCGEGGDWQRNVTRASGGDVPVFSLGYGYKGWVVREGPISLELDSPLKGTLIVWASDGVDWTRTTRAFEGDTVSLPAGRFYHRVEVRPALPFATAVPTATATSMPVPTFTPVPPTLTPTVTPVVLPTPTATPTSWQPYDVRVRILDDGTVLIELKPR